MLRARVEAGAGGIDLSSLADQAIQTPGNPSQRTERADHPELVVGLAKRRGHMRDDFGGKRLIARSQGIERPDRQLDEFALVERDEPCRAGGSIKWSDFSNQRKRLDEIEDGLVASVADEHDLRTAGCEDEKEIAGLPLIKMI